MGYLKYIELENFKSYKGNIQIGPFKQFTSIIGPNGSGKSNLMDAISFVLGESTKNLRVKKLSELIHGAPIGKPVSNKASVSFIYAYKENEGEDKENIEDENSENSFDSEENEVKFSRIVHGASSEYRVNGKVVSTVDYQAELEKIGIYIKAKNFLVYQGQVESIAMKSAKEITQVFEEISRSIELKDEYERLKQEMEKAEEDTQANFQKKRGVAAQKKEAKIEKEEAEKYQKLTQQLHDQEIQLRLFQLYYNEKAIEETEEEHEKRQAEYTNFESKRSKLDDEIKEHKRKQGQFTREMTRIEDQVKDFENKLSKKRPQFIKAKENSSHLIKKLEISKSSYEAALKANESHVNEIKVIEKEIQELEKRRINFEKEIEQESLSQGTSLELRESKMREYQALKEQVAKQNTKVKDQLDTLNREQKSDQDAYDNELRKKNETTVKINQKTHELDDQEQKLSKLIEYIENTEKQIDEQKESETRLAVEIEKAKALSKSLDTELGKIMNDIGDAKVDKFESSRNLKKAEVIEQLKKKFPGVLGRLIDHCEPIHRKYQVAITKVMGKSMDAIVVETEKIARDCIQFMKEQHLPLETFYPLDFIESPNLDERLREIREPKNTKLLVDVIKYNPPQIKKALLFSVGNCLVCETDEDARQLAFSNTNGTRHKVVSFDGTLFQKSGLISGGSSELKQKARRWDEKYMDQLRKKKDEYSEQLKEQIKIRRREPDLVDLKSNIKGLEYRLKYAKQNRELAEQKVIATLEKDLEQLNRERTLHDPNTKEIEKRVGERTKKISKLKEDSNKIEDEIFKDFCKEINVANIRVYEERELAGQQERVKERMKFEEEKNSLTSKLEFEKSRDTLKSYHKWEKEAQEHEKDLKKLKKEEAALLESINQIEKDILSSKGDMDKHKESSNQVEIEIGEVKKKLSAHNKELNEFRKKVASSEAKHLDKKLERHKILKNSKLELVDLPMVAGTMDDISEEDQQTQLTQQQSEQPATESLVTVSTNDQNLIFEREAKIKIDYRRLKSANLNLPSNDEIEKCETRILNELNETKDLLKHFQAPNFKADEKLDTVKEIWENTAAEFDKARILAKKARNAFMKVKQERYDRYNSCFEHISNKIDEIYKSLCMNQGAQASLVLENAEEPFLDGVIYNCVAPGKRFRQMDNLSGGEKTIAALGLLFAIRSYNPSPFFVLDEVDAALDNTNISKVANYIVEQTKKGLQCIVISLKEEFFHHADSIVGVYPELSDCIASKIIGMDLSKYDEE